MTHDPSEYIRGLQQLLVSDKKRIAFLFGAGTSLAKKNDSSIIVPAIEKMTKDIESYFNKNKKYETAIKEIRSEIEGRKENHNVETLLSNIEQKIQVIGDGTLNGLMKNDLKQLLIEIKSQIRVITSVHKEIMNEKGSLIEFVGDEKEINLLIAENNGDTKQFLRDILSVSKEGIENCNTFEEKRDIITNMVNAHTPYVRIDVA